MDINDNVLGIITEFNGLNHEFESGITYECAAKLANKRLDSNLFSYDISINENTVTYNWINGVEFSITKEDGQYDFESNIEGFELSNFDDLKNLLETCVETYIQDIETNSANLSAEAVEFCKEKGVEFTEPDDAFHMTVEGEDLDLREYKEINAFKNHVEIIQHDDEFVVDPERFDWSLPEESEEKDEEFS